MSTASADKINKVLPNKGLPNPISLKNKILFHMQEGKLNGMTAQEIATRLGAGLKATRKALHELARDKEGPFVIPEQQERFICPEIGSRYVVAWHCL